MYDSFARYGSGVTLIAAQADGDHKFFIATSVMTASVQPFTLGVSVGQDRQGLRTIVSGAPWTVNVLSTKHLPMVQELIGSTSLEQRLAALNQAGAETSAEGPLWLPDSLTTFWCELHKTAQVYDQVLLVGKVERVETQDLETPLVRWNRDFHSTTKPLSG